VSDSGRRTVVSVQIAGEEYTIRSEASTEYTRECAEYVDRTIRDILGGVPTMQAHRVPVLAALAITDQLLRANRELAELRSEVERRAARLSGDIRQDLEAAGLATPS
jgi:cell division protein ZapA (FtsZ GTPase activity inhibitor)